jgi:hypothetical protein
VSAFAEWVATECVPDSTCIWWDFDRAPGIEGIDILQDLADQLPAASAFSSELSAVKTEFGNGPMVHVVQEVGTCAEAGENQTFSAVANVPSLPDHIDRNLNRLARALFRDIRSASENGHVLVVISGVRVGCEDPVPCERMLKVILSTLWRLAENCSADGLCAVIAATIASADDLETPGLHYPCSLGLIDIEEAVNVFVQSIEGLSITEAQSAVLTVAEPGTGGISYTQLREGLARLELNRLELTLGGATDA